MTTTYIRERPEISGRIYMRHFRTVDMCAKGSRRILLAYYGMSGKEVSELFKNGMDINEFKKRFGHDAMAQQVIAFYESEVTDGRE